MTLVITLFKFNQIREFWRTERRGQYYNIVMPARAIKAMSVWSQRGLNGKGYLGVLPLAEKHRMHLAEDEHPIAVVLLDVELHLKTKKISSR